MPARKSCASRIIGDRGGPPDGGLDLPLDRRRACPRRSRAATGSTPVKRGHALPPGHDAGCRGRSTAALKPGWSGHGGAVLLDDRRSSDRVAGAARSPAVDSWACPTGASSKQTAGGAGPGHGARSVGRRPGGSARRGRRIGPIAGDPRGSPTRPACSRVGRGSSSRRAARWASWKAATHAVGQAVVDLAVGRPSTRTSNAWPK